jgi:hypothetical protein
MFTGHAPSAVLLPTFQDHDTKPLLSACLSSNPCAPLGPLL